MTPHRTRTHRATQAIRAAQAARKALTRTAVIARQLDEIAPGTARVRTVPVQCSTGTERLTTWVTLDNALGQPLAADRTAHRAARNLLRRMFPAADWTTAQEYDTRTGALTAPAPLVMPAELTDEAGGGELE
ncbi:hypothetical protein [Streptomyces chryseus]